MDEIIIIDDRVLQAINVSRPELASFYFVASGRRACTA